jgi:hypothetical protein
MHMPDFSHIADTRTRASAQIAVMQVDAAHKILMANAELYGSVSLDAVVVIALAQVIATNHASGHFVSAGAATAA